MSFLASNDRILITDTDGAVVFDTSANMPCVTHSVSINLDHTFPFADYYKEGWYPIQYIGFRPDFIICRAVASGVFYNYFGGVTSTVNKTSSFNRRLSLVNSFSAAPYMEVTYKEEWGKSLFAHFYDTPNGESLPNKPGSVWDVDLTVWAGVFNI
jgi:hypothetical protein